MKYLVIDIEVSMFPHSSPWDEQAFLCSIGLESKEWQKTWLFNHISEPIRNHKEMIGEIQREIDNHDLLVFHNAKFDLAWLLKAGINFYHKPVWCTMVGDYVLFGQNKNIELSLNECAIRRNIPGKFDLMAQFWQEGYNTDEIPWSVHDQYLRQDTRCTKMVYEIQVKQVAKAKLTHIVKISSEITKILAEMEYNGIKFNKERAKELVQEYKQELELLDKSLQEQAGIKFNPSSSLQLATIMYGGILKKEVDEIVAKPRKNGTFRVFTKKAIMEYKYKGLGFQPTAKSFSVKTGRYSVGKKALLLVQYYTDKQREFKTTLDKRQLAATCIKTIYNKDPDKGWLNKVCSDGRIHPSFNNCFSVTGRLTSSNPNGQNLPRGSTSPLKQLFVSDLGVILNVDLSQIEWRMAAALSKDPVMCKEIIEGLDCHTENAEKFFNIKRDDPSFKLKARQPCKIFNFRMIYDGKASSFFNDGEMPRYPIEFWKEIVDGFWKKYKVLRKWQHSNEKFINRHKYLRNSTGRILTFPFNSNPDEGPIGFKFSKVCNYPVQSASLDLMLIAMLEIVKAVKEKKLKAKPLLQVHDSFVWDCPKEEVYTLMRICLSTFNNLPELSEQYYGWKPCVPIDGTGSIGLTYGNLGNEIKNVHECTPEAVDKLIQELI